MGTCNSLSTVTERSQNARGCLMKIEGVTEKENR